MEKDAQIATEEEFVEKPDPTTLMPDLYDAAKANDLTTVTSLLDDDVPPTFLDEVSGLTALHWAAMRGNITMVRLLLSKGASTNYAQAAKLRASQRAAALALATGSSTNNRSTARRNSEGSIGGGEEPSDEYSAAGEEKSSKSGAIAAAAANYGESTDVLDEEEIDALLPYLKNTPLLWAAFKGHLRIVWLLLTDGYSPNDVDDMGNNALHLAAVNQHERILKVLIDDGGSANAVNFYKNRPIDMATKRPIREMLTEAMVEGASYTDADVARKHAANMQSYNKYTVALQHAIAESRKFESARFSLSMNIPDAMRSLSDALQDAEEWCLDQDLCAHATQLMTKLEVLQDLTQDTSRLQKAQPLRTQTDYIEYVHKLEKSMERARHVGLDRNQLQVATDLIARANVEYWVETMANRLRAVPIAKDCHEHDMNRLRAAILKAEALKASEEIVDSATILHGRLHTELGLYRAMQGLPIVRLPVENPAEGYYQESDIGHIEETEGYPLPPAETGIYVWIHSEAFTGLQSAIDTLKKLLSSSATPAGNEGAVVNPALVAEAKEKLIKAEKDLKHLATKDEADKALAIEAATKLAKKLKKKGGSPKKKKE